MAEFKEIEVSDLPAILGRTKTAQPTQPEAPVEYDEFDIKPSDLPRVLGKRSGGSTGYSSTYKGPSYPGASVIDPLAATIIKAAPFGVGYAMVGDNAEKRVNDVLDYYGPKVSIPAETVAGVGKAAAEYYTLKKVLGTLGAGASMLAGSKYGAPVVKAVSKVPGVKKLGDVLTSTNKYKRAAGLVGTVGTAVTGANLAAGEDLATSVAKGVETAGDIAAYSLIGSSSLPKKLKPVATAGYEAVTGGIGRAQRGEKVLDPYQIAQDVTRGALFGKGETSTRPTEPSIKGSPAANAADVYKEPIPGEKSSTNVLLKNIKKAPKKEGATLLDLDTPENERFYRALAKKNPTRAGDLSLTMGAKKEAVATEIENSIKEKYPFIQPTKEDLGNEIDRLGSNIGVYTNPIREAHVNKGQKYIPKSRVDKLLGKEGDVRKAFDDTYNATSEGMWHGDIIRPNEGYDTLVTLETRRKLSDLGRNNNYPYHKKAAEKSREVFGKGEWLKRYKEADNAYHKAIDFESAVTGNSAGSEANYMNTLKTLSDNTLKGANETNKLISDTATKNTNIPAGLRDAMNRYNYLAKSENILSSGTGTSTPSLGSTAAETASAKFVGGRIADYLMAKTGIKRAQEYIAKHTLDKVVEDLGSLSVEDAIKALTAKHGKIKGATQFVPSVYETIKNLPKRKERKK